VRPPLDPEKQAMADAAREKAAEAGTPVPTAETNAAKGSEDKA